MEERLIYSCSILTVDREPADSFSY